MARFRFALSLLLVPALIAPLSSAQKLPTTWVDKDTGHRVYRLTNEPGSSGFYFNVNAYSPDGKLMAYVAPDGIHVMELATRKTRLLVANPPHADEPNTPRALSGRLHAIVVGRKTNSIFFSHYDRKADQTIISKVDMYTGKVTQLVSMKGHVSIPTVNADETLAAGTMDDGPAVAPSYGQNARYSNSKQAGNLLQPENKGEMMERRLASRQPLILFTVDLRPGPNNGKIKVLLHSTDWINHLLFSPTDPELLMYCHEGPWQKVDRIWMIHTDGTHNTLIHHRTMAMEIAGHEFWGLDGRTIWYDWQFPKGEDFFLAGYNLVTHQRTAYHMQRNEWSIHFNLTRDLDLFTGDGGDPGQVAKAPDGEWIELFHPHMIPITPGAINSPDFWQPGVFHAEHLVNMAHHNYRLEPNVRFSPDKSMVIFTSNMFGPSYVFGVEVKKAVNPNPAEVLSTPALGEKYNPGKVLPTHVTH